MPVTLSCNTARGELEFWGFFFFLRALCFLYLAFTFTFLAEVIPPDKMLSAALWIFRLLFPAFLPHRHTFFLTICSSSGVLSSWAIIFFFVTTS